MDRRNFIKTSVASTTALGMGDWSDLFAKGTRPAEVGKKWGGWTKGQFQVHFIYTGASESLFFILPDGTTMLLDCGDYDVTGHQKPSVPFLPHKGRHAGEWIARYVERVNPHGNVVDYMMLSHYHSDHCGCEEFHAGTEQYRGNNYYLSGFALAARTLSFHRAIDRCWPTYDDPMALHDDGEHTVRQMQTFYRRMIEERGLQVEKFRLGAVNQIAMQYAADDFPTFQIQNICGNGRICAPDGTIRDLYAERIANGGLQRVNENGMSLGLIVSYGSFRFFTAGDFSDHWTLADGNTFEIEDALAEACGPVNVAKINHHGHYSMPRKLVAALRAQVYASCVWCQRHNVAPVMERLTNRNIYPGDRIVCPGMMPAERRATDESAPWMKDVAPASFDGGHVVLKVEPGGKKFSMTYLSAADESMTVRSVMHFKTQAHK